MDKGTLIRTIALVIALANQMFAIFGVEQLPITEDQVNIVVELIYQIVSAVSTIVAAFLAWFKNNYVTYRGKTQREVLKNRGLIK